MIMGSPQPSEAMHACMHCSYILSQYLYFLPCYIRGHIVVMNLHSSFTSTLAFIGQGIPQSLAALCCSV